MERRSGHKCRFYGPLEPGIWLTEAQSKLHDPRLLPPEPPKKNRDRLLLHPAGCQFLKHAERAGEAQAEQAAEFRVCRIPAADCPFVTARPFFLLRAGALFPLVTEHRKVVSEEVALVRVHEAVVMEEAQIVTVLLQNAQEAAEIGIGRTCGCRRLFLYERQPRGPGRGGMLRLPGQIPRAEQAARSVSGVLPRAGDGAEDTVRRAALQRRSLQHPGPEKRGTELPLPVNDAQVVEHGCFVPCVPANEPPDAHCRFFRHRFPHTRLREDREEVSRECPVGTVVARTRGREFLQEEPDAPCRRNSRPCAGTGGIRHAAHCKYRRP